MTDDLKVDAVAALAEAYGRTVPGKVRLAEHFDLPDGCRNELGDTVVVAAPPDDVEIDDCSLFVWLDFGGEDPVRERVYEHEVVAVTSD